MGPGHSVGGAPAPLPYRKDNRMTLERSIAYYGWRPDLPDHRDYMFSPRREGAALPVAKSVDLRDKFAAPYDQGQLGSCTANAIAGALQFVDQTSWNASRLAVYYRERAIEGTTGQDAGAEIRDGIKVVANGYAPEDLWPYNIQRFTEPPPQEYVNAETTHHALTYRRIGGFSTVRTKQIKQALTAGLPVVFGFTVFESFEGQYTGDTGYVRMPTSNDRAIGGHAVLIVGYQIRKGRLYFTVRNSWGDQWGDHGYFYMPTKYVGDPNLCDDFWVIETAN